MLEKLIALSMLQLSILAYLLITKSKWLDNLLGENPQYETKKELCICGEILEDCPDAYDHTTHGV